MRIFLFPALASVIVATIGCDSTGPSDWPPKFTRFSVALYNVRVNYYDGANTYASALSYKYNYYIPDSNWRYSLNNFETSGSAAKPSGDPVGTATLSMKLQLRPTGNGYYELNFSGDEASEGFAPSSRHGYSRKSATDIDFTLNPVTIWDDDTLELVWRGDDLDRVLRSLSYASYNHTSSSSGSSGYTHSASALSPQPDSAAITVKLYK